MRKRQKHALGFVAQEPKFVTLIQLIVNSANSVTWLIKYRPASGRAVRC